MERVIKFRAWDNSDNKMHYIESRFLHPHNGSTTKRIKIYSDGWRMEQESHQTERELFEQNSGDLMQYIGLTDKNGKEIYEGDIVKSNDRFIDVVKFHGGIFYSHNGTPVCRFGSTEVIGNIYENPELLEATK